MKPSIIVAAIDFTDCGLAALDQACAMAIESGASLHVVYVLPIKMSRRWARFSVAGTLTSNALHESDLAQSTIFTALAQHQVAEAVVRVMLGDPAEVIVEYASEHHADVIVCGSHERHGAQRVLGHDVSKSLLQASHCAVMAVKAPATPEWAWL